MSPFVRAAKIKEAGWKALLPLGRLPDLGIHVPKIDLRNILAKNTAKCLWLGATVLIVLNFALLFSPRSVSRALNDPQAWGPATADLVAQLKNAGLGAAPAGQVRKENFSVSGAMIVLGGDNIQVFEYANAAAATAEATGIGKNIALGQPGRSASLYQRGSLLIFYMGTNEKILDALSGIAGMPLAG